MIHPHFRPGAWSGEILHSHCPRQGRLNTEAASALLLRVPSYTIGLGWRKHDLQRLIPRCLSYFNLHVQKTVTARSSEPGFVRIILLRTTSSAVTTTSKQNGICFTSNAFHSSWRDITFQTPELGKMGLAASRRPSKCIPARWRQKFHLMHHSRHLLRA